ncbi:MAG: NCS2 family permease, partial [Sporichthyaceae bacterium]|nr:NCS2 family permease [Sporichthyaceae bacterium]
MSGTEAPPVTEPEAAPPSRSGIDRYFQITERGSTVGQEIRGGLATFFTMAYIVVLNPLIIGTVLDADGKLLGGAADPSGSIALVAAATALIAGVLTILMGVIGRYPLAMATGLGLNAFVAVGIASQMSWQDAMGLVVLEGLVITILVLTGFRITIFRAIPAALKTAIAVGIGLFIAFIGFVDAGFVRRVEAPISVPVQLSTGTGSLTGWPTLVFVVGVLLTAILVIRKTKGAILIGIIATTVLALIVEAIADVGGALNADGSPNPDGWRLGVPEAPDKLTEAPDLSLLGDVSLFGGFERAGIVTALLIVFTLLLADFFDTMGTVTAVGQQAGLTDERGDLPGADRVLLVDSIGAAAGGAASVSSNTTYIESSAGVAEGARTGFASVVTGVLFLVAMFFTPLVQSVPFEAATPALVVVGFLLMTQIKNIDFDDWEVAVPAFLTMVLMPFTFSITNGIGAGFVSYVAIKTARGKAREVHPLLWLIAVLFVVYFALTPLK